MHWWQVAMFLVLVANCLSNFSKAIRARREHRQERLHWLLPKAIGWATLFFAVLPTRWGGVSTQHWYFVAGVGLVLLVYGMIIDMTDLSSPQLPWGSIETPHYGTIGLQHMAIIPIFGFLAVGWHIFQHRQITIDDEALLVAFSLGLLFGVRLYLRQFSLNRLSDLVELLKPRTRTSGKQSEKYWVKSGEE